MVWYGMVPVTVVPARPLSSPFLPFPRRRKERGATGVLSVELDFVITIIHRAGMEGTVIGHPRARAEGTEGGMLYVDIAIHVFGGNY